MQDLHFRSTSVSRCVSKWCARGFYRSVFYCMNEKELVEAAISFLTNAACEDAPILPGRQVVLFLPFSFFSFLHWNFIEIDEKKQPWGKASYYYRSANAYLGCVLVEKRFQAMWKEAAAAAVKWSAKLTMCKITDCICKRMQIWNEIINCYLNVCEIYTLQLLPTYFIDT